MTELYIFSQDDDLLTVLSDNELTDAPIKDLLNNVSNEPFVFTVYADAEKAKYVTERNRVVVKDREGDFREFVIDELDDINDKDGPETTATCLPAWQFELQKNFVEDRRFTDRTAQFALDAALEGTRFIGEVEVVLGEASTNFYRLASSDCIWKIMDVWGGEFKDTIVLNEKGRISQRKIQLSQRRGADIGARFEIDHNMNSIERTVISDPITAMYGWGASLETEGGGHTRYIDFKDIEWKVSNGDPVDKPKGQAWVGDPDALQKYGLEHNGELLHLYDEFSNQDYEDPEELLMATWEHLQKVKDPEINYKMSVDLLDKPVSLGDTAQGIDRQFSRPIEVQARIIGIEYDILEPDDPAIVEMGHFLSLNDDIIGRELDEIKENLNKPRPTKPIDENSFPDIKPDIPLNVEAVGLFETIKISWDYDFHVYVSHYEVYGSQVADFVPDTQHLLWRGDVSSFGHEVNPDETWYYYVRALNTRGTPSDWSGRVSASSRRIITDDILFGEIKAEHLADGLDLANKISNNTIDFINEGPLLEIQRKEDEILSEVSSRIGDVLNDIGTLEGSIVSVEQTVNEELGLISNSIMETNVRIDNLDIRGTNFISHLPENWIWIWDDMIGTRRAVRIEPNEDYVLSTYGDYNAGITIRDSSGNDLVSYVVEENGEDGDFITFTTPSNARSFLMVIDGEVNGEWINVDMIGTDVKVKLALGNEHSGWTPNLDDTGQLVANVQTYVSEFNHRADSLELAVTGVEGGLEDAVADIGRLQVESDNLLLSVGQISGDLEAWGVGNRNLFSIESLEDWGPVKNTAVKAALSGDSQITYRRHGDSFGTNTDFRILFYENFNDTDSIASISVRYNVVEQTHSVPSNAKYIGFLINGDLSMDSLRDSEIKIEEGSEASNYSLAPEDMSGIDRAVSFINMDKEGIRIHGSKIQITGQTIMEDAVIGTAAIADLAVSRAKLQRAVIGEAQIDDLAVTNAKIGWLAVDSQNVNYSAIVNAHIADLHVDKLTGSIANFIQTGFNNVSYEVEITGAGLSTYSGGSRTSLLDGRGQTFYRNNRSIGHIGTSSWVGDSSYRGLRFGLEYDADYMTWSFRETANASAFTTMLAWHRSGTKDDKGFIFYDNVRIDSRHTLRNSYFRTASNTSRIVSLNNETFSGYDGVAFRRDSNRDGDGAGIFMTGARVILTTPMSSGSSTHNSLEVTRNYINSISIWNNTNSSSANVHISNSGRLTRASSASRYKLLIENEEKKGYDYSRILNLNISSWYDKPNVERYANLLNGKTGNEEDRDSDIIKRHFGLVAEHLVREGLSEFVEYNDETGEVEGIQYDRLWTLLIPVVRDLKLDTEDNFDLLKMKNEYLSNKVTHLERRVENLEKLLEVA